MRRDNQIGVILGIVILVIIGVFLSTRTSDIETVIPDLVLSEEVRQESEIEEIDINKITKISENSEQKEASSVEYPSDEALVKEKLVNPTQPEEQPEQTLVETAKDDTSLEGKWEGIAQEVAEEIVEEPEKTEIIVDTGIAHKFPSTEGTVIPEAEQQTPSYGFSNDIIYKVQSNDSLIKIARKHYGDDKKWVKIYEANRDSMADPDALYVGQELLIPNTSVGKKADQAFQTSARKKSNKERSANVNTHTVVAGDTLYRLAEKYYDDPTVWIKIYEANEGIIKDKRLLKEGQILIIPKL
jgi:Uncharacterized protein containing LysM domain